MGSGDPSLGRSGALIGSQEGGLGGHIQDQRAHIWGNGGSWGADMGSKNRIGGTYGVLGGDTRPEGPRLGSLGHRYGVK